jgi:tetratricopeptide (TPR) repeat protein
MHAYSDKITAENTGQTIEFPRVAFLCTLIKKEVIDKIGGLDERFTPGNFEDDDFCLRSQLAGFKTVISKDVFIHHYGSVSFKNNGEDHYDELLKVNEQKFIDKWGSNPEGIWLEGASIKKHSIDIPLNSDKFIQFFERSMRNIDDEEFHYAIENLNLAMEHYETSSKIGYDNISLEDLLNIAGNLALTKNNLEDAKKYFEKQLETNPSSSNACFGLAEVFNIAEMFYESKTMLEWTLNNDSKHEKAQERLKEINRKLNLPENHNSLIEQDIKK